MGEKIAQYVRINSHFDHSPVNALMPSMVLLKLYCSW